MRGTCNNRRNLADRHIRAIATTRGVIGIALFKGAVCGHRIEDTVKAMRYVAELVGVDYVALGSDFDGAVTTPIDASGLPLHTQAMMAAGFTQEGIEKILYKNVLRVLRESLPAS